MGSLTISGWSSENAAVELQDIIETFQDFDIDKMNNIDTSELDSALSVVTCVYLDQKLSKEVKKQAFLVAEILEYVKSQGCYYARSIIRTALDEVVGDDSASDEERQTATDIVLYFNNLFNLYGFKHLRQDQVFNSFEGNYVYFKDMKLKCFDSREAMEKLVLANAIIQSPYDFIDVASTCQNHGFSSVEEYFDYLAAENFDEWMKSQKERGKITIDYLVLDDRIRELVK